MPDFFRDRLQRDLERFATPDGYVKIANMLATWAVDLDWTRAVLELSPQDRGKILAQLGGETFDRDGGHYATNLRNNTESLDFIWKADERKELLRRHTEMLFAGVADRVAFGRPDQSRLAIADADLIGREHIDAARKIGKGIILLSVHQSHPAFAFKHPVFSDLSFSAVFHDYGNESSPSMLRQGIADRVEVLGASRGSVRRMLKRLQQNQCVSIYIDFVFPESGGVPTGLFGRVVRISSSAVAIALRTGAAVVPITSARQYPPESGRVSVECYPPIPLDDLDRNCPGDLEIAAFRFGMTAELLIRRYPAQWTLWNSLQHRWREAEHDFNGKTDGLM